MKNYGQNKQLTYLKYWGLNNLCGWAMLQRLPVNKFEQIEVTSQFNEDFIKNYNEECDKQYFLEIDVQYPEKLNDLHNDLQLYLKEWRLN